MKKYFAILIIIGTIVAGIIYIKHHSSTMVDYNDVVNPPNFRHVTDSVENQNMPKSNKSFERPMQNLMETTTIGRSQFVVPEPTIKCPGEIRYGNYGDAGKWVCSPGSSSDDCTVYSLGVGGDTEFENAIFKATNGRCKIFCFDKGEQNPSLFAPFNGTFKPWKIATVSVPSENEYSLPDILAHFRHKKVEFLKIDIESMEFHILPDILRMTSGQSRTLETCQLFVEVHYTMNNVTSGEIENLQNAFDRSDFRMFHKEVNPGCPTCFEFSYLNKNCFQQYGVKE